MLECSTNTNHTKRTVLRAVIRHSIFNIFLFACNSIHVVVEGEQEAAERGRFAGGQLQDVTVADKNSDLIFS